MTINGIEDMIGYNFKDKGLLVKALTHKSFDANENYERLEFLGDAVISAICSELVYMNFPMRNEGELSKIKSAIVSLNTLSSIGKSLKINDFINMEKGELQAGGRGKKRIIGNVYESVIGAVFLDSGYEYAKQVFLDHLNKTGILSNIEVFENPDYKTRLQELAQKRFDTVPKYFTLNKEGPAHKVVFTVCVKINNKIYGYGRELTKKAAEQIAAGNALKHKEFKGLDDQKK